MLVKEQLITAMEIFDAKMRRVNWKTWNTNSGYTHAVEYNNHLYPIGHILWMATRTRRSDRYWSGHLEKLGFKIVELQREPPPVIIPEREFEQAIIEPLIQRLGFRGEAQYPCRFYTGASIYKGKIDFFVSDDQGPVTLFEDKVRILTSQDMDKACGQAKSYALMHGLSSFVIAAPEGIWVYSLHKHREQLEKKYSLKEIQTDVSDLKALLLKLR